MLGAICHQETLLSYPSQGVGLVLEVAEQKLQVSDFPQFNVGREAHTHLKGQPSPTLELQLLAGQLDRGWEAVVLPLLLGIRGQGVRAHLFHGALQNAEIGGGEGVDAQVGRHAGAHEADVLRVDFHIGLELVERHDLHHGGGTLGREAYAGRLEIKHHAVHRRAQLLIAEGHAGLGEAALNVSHFCADAGDLALQLLHALLQDRLLPQPVHPGLHEAALGFLHLVALL